MVINLQIIDKRINEIKPYEKNPRKNDEAVKYVAESIKQFGFKVPIVIDKDCVIVCGHTRYKAAKKLKLDTVPCLMADDLTDEQIKAFRLADNKVSEKAEWDFDLLGEEISDLINFDMTDFGFELADEVPNLCDSFIDDLLEKELGQREIEQDSFKMTLIFPLEYKTAAENYLASNGKQKLIELCLAEMGVG